MGYIVVFEGTGEPNSNTKGVRTWTSYEDENNFVQSLLNSENGDLVIASGVDPEEAIRLVEEARTEDRIAGAIEGSLNANGRLDRKILEMRLNTLAFCMGRGKEGGTSSIVASEQDDSNL